MFLKGDYNIVIDSGTYSQERMIFKKFNDKNHKQDITEAMNSYITYKLKVDMNQYSGKET